MRVTVFTSNQPRHFSLIEKLAAIAEHVYAIQECTTLFPGKIKDYYHSSPVMERYFSHVLAAEREVFGQIRFCPRNCSSLPLFMGDINHLPLEVFGAALESDYFVVFGASYIKGPLCDFLVSKKAFNIHMGASPYYRGNSCNFWAIKDGRADYVCGTLHLLTKGLDSGPILAHALPRSQPVDPFVLGMMAVSVGQNAACNMIQTGALEKLAPVLQDRSQELRYTKNNEFTDDVAEQYLRQRPSPEEVEEVLKKRDLSKFVNPYVM